VAAQVAIASVFAAVLRGHIGLSFASSFIGRAHDRGVQHQERVAHQVQRKARGGYENAGPLKAGDSVEAEFPGTDDWYLGWVEKDNGDGTYDVKWEDPDGGPAISKCKADVVKSYKPPMMLSELQVGQLYKGVVIATAKFGAFVDIGAEVQGLVHISAMRDGFVDNVDDEVREGQEVDCWVKSVSTDKLSLVMVESKLGSGSEQAQAARGPEDLRAFADLKWGEPLAGKVVSVKDFGCLVTVEQPSGGMSTTGLVHISHVSDGFVQDIYSHVEVGEEVTVYVRDASGEKLSLSMRSPN